MFLNAAYSDKKGLAAAGVQAEQGLKSFEEQVSSTCKSFKGDHAQAMASAMWSNQAYFQIVQLKRAERQAEQRQAPTA